ncbi:hypothetical protein [Micromonospora sp. KC721]|uniref:hypothetical protein n=1 Tax=Micromonospora sp. KC721 TaxID=2530380 RepID=UPI0010533FB8|nr:hypothetical protein [Micromonospora sp. KC721]TDB79910.1 hypothetical protein E1182_11035 [Micromonospora sp. KC721]
MAAGIEVDVAAVKRLQAAAAGVAAAMGAMEARVVAAGDLPDSAFGRLPVVSDMLRGAYAEQVSDGTALFRAGQDAFDRVGDALASTVDNYERNEQGIESGFRAVHERMGR